MIKFCGVKINKLYLSGLNKNYIFSFFTNGVKFLSRKIHDDGLVKSMSMPEIGFNKRRRIKSG